MIFESFATSKITEPSFLPLTAKSPDPRLSLAVKAVPLGPSMAPFASSIFQSNVLKDNSLFDLLTIETFALTYSLPSLALMNWLPESQLRSIDLIVTSLPSKAIVSPTLKVVFSDGLFSEVALLLFELTTVALFCCDALYTPIIIITTITQNQAFLKTGFSLLCSFYPLL